MDDFLLLIFLVESIPWCIQVNLFLSIMPPLIVCILTSSQMVCYPDIEFLFYYNILLI